MSPDAGDRRRGGGHHRRVERHRPRDGLSGFADPEFLARLDVVVARRYFDALEAPLPPAVRPLLDTRADGDVAPVQHVLAGMNAHIVYDLPIALAATGSERLIELRAASPAARSTSPSWTAQPPREAGCSSKTHKADQVLSIYC